METAGRHILITGANRGIGRAFAVRFAQDKAHLHLTMRNLDTELAKELQAHGAASVQVYQADLATRAGVEKLLNEIQDLPVDILINNAGLLTGGLIEEQPLDEIYNMFQVNVNALVHLSRAVIPGMVKRGRGKIVNNASVSAYMHFPCASTYAASKAAVVAFTNCIHAELKSTGVSTLILVTPGIKTRMFDEIEVKYAKNFEIPQDSISPQVYAEMVREAIINDLTLLEPGGATAVGLKIAKYVQPLFQWEIARRFKRS